MALVMAAADEAVYERDKPAIDYYYALPGVGDCSGLPHRKIMPALFTRGCRNGRCDNNMTIFSCAVLIINSYTDLAFPNINLMERAQGKNNQR